MKPDDQPTTTTSHVEQFKPKKSGAKKLLKLLFILLLLALVGGGVWYWQQTKINKLEKEKKAAEEQAKRAGGEDEAEVVRVQVVRPADRSFSVEAPVSWFSDTCGDNLIFIAPTQERLGKCNSEYFGMISVSKTGGDVRGSASDYSSPDYADVRSENVTVNGVSGLKLSYRFVGQSEVGYPATGSSFISYRLFDGTSTFTANYDRNAGETDYGREFEAIVNSLDTTP